MKPEEVINDIINALADEFDFHDSETRRVYAEALVTKVIIKLCKDNIENFWSNKL